MSQQQYTAIQKMRLIDLVTLPAHILHAWLRTKPLWMQQALAAPPNH